MSDECDQFRYLFSVRQRFNEVPEVDSFYEIMVPAGITADHAKVMTKLKKDWCKEEISKDTQALHGMQLRLRFNSDMYPNVCLVRTHSAITADDLEHIIQSKYERGEMMDFLEESAIK